MKRSQSSSVAIFGVLALAAGAMSSAQVPLDTDISYQGRLVRNGGPVQESTPGCDFRFRMFGSPLGPDQWGPAWGPHTVPVEAGLFTVDEIDFGPGVFTGDERWLSVEVLCPGDTGYTELAPRQPVTAAPYAVHALNTKWEAVGTAIHYDAGLVGIGTAAPTERMQVTGDLRVVSNSDVTTAAGSGAIYIETASGDSGLHIDHNEIQSRGDTLHLNHDRQSDTLIGQSLRVLTDKNVRLGGNLHLDNGDPTNPPFVSLMLDTGLNSGSWTAEVRQTETSQLQLINGNRNNPVAGARLVIDPDGRIGVNTLDPQSSLHVEGTTTTKVLEITGGADLSEHFDVSPSATLGPWSSPDNQIRPGAVVSIDPDSPGDLVVSTTEYDRGVAGVISGAAGIAPGMLMGQSGSVADGAHPVALTGRVYVQADAASGPIVPGDLLTTSNTPGHAQSVLDHRRAQGAILGKALTSLAEGRGLVLVLVTLQ